jgi:hypothetical protein
MVELVMRVSRDDDNRLGGTVRSADAQEALSFSGTLELMRVFEELVPVDPVAAAAQPAGHDSRPVVPGSSLPPEPSAP